MKQPDNLCPVCQRTEIADDGWCNACHGLTTVKPPNGFCWVRLRGGPVDAGRMLPEDNLPNDYSIVSARVVYHRRPGTRDYYLHEVS